MRIIVILVLLWMPVGDSAGAEVFRHRQLPIRKADSVKIRSVHDQCRIDSRRFTRPTRFWVDNLVVASAYIGPMQTGLKRNPSY